MITLEKLTSDLNLNQVDEVLAGYTTTKDGKVQSSGGGWFGGGLTWTTVVRADGTEYMALLWE
ncbi:hypothetical protein [Flavobacterium sp.]|uniref:hypothetical protein n=1 Tax=Flavobacterium sp. TaxID=239 RepID=UPI003F6A181C